MQNGILNLPRHPSQLYEAFFEGIILWLIIWFIKDRKPFRGFILGLYVGGYGIFRFFIEYFREPDENLGYILQFMNAPLPIEVSHPPFCFSMGQLLCFLQVCAAVIWLIVAAHLPNREPWKAGMEKIAEPQPVKNKNAARNARRKLQKKR
jgi:phosphatidylglycerol:prolipoprotein diacylglycerol transferase